MSDPDWLTPHDDKARGRDTRGLILRIIVVGFLVCSSGTRSSLPGGRDGQNCKFVSRGALASLCRRHLAHQRRCGFAHLRPRSGHDAWPNRFPVLALSPTPVASAPASPLSTASSTCAPPPRSRSDWESCAS